MAVLATANKAEIVLGPNNTRWAIFIQNLGPGVVTMSKDHPPGNSTDGANVVVNGILKDSGPKVFKGTWYAMASVDNTTLYVDETTAS